MPEMHTSSQFSGFIEISPPLSPQERDYINTFKRTRRVDRIQGPYFVTTMNPQRDESVIDCDTPTYGQPSLWCQWEITDDGSRIVFDEDEHEFDKPLEWMVYLIDHFLRLKPFVMEEFPQVLREYGIPNFSGHICNGHIQCRKYHNIVVENNRVGKELSWPNGKIEWMNEPEAVFEAMKDFRDRAYRLPQINPKQLWQSIEANRIDEWKECQDMKEITREDVEILKADWEADPIWDLEETEGFEAYRDELKAFADEKRAWWNSLREQQERKRIDELHQKAAELGCSFGVMQYISTLEGRIKHLERQVGVLLEYSDAAAYREIKGF